LSEDFAMNMLRTGLTTAAIAMAVGSAGVISANAAPLFLPKAATATGQADVIQVRDGVRWRNGYRGYPRYRAGYRDYDGWWYPAGAFVAGALIGGAIANSNAYYGDRYYGSNYYSRYYEPRYYEPRYYEPRYYEPERVYYPPRSSYRAGYRDGYRDGYYSRRYGNAITCTQRLDSAGKC
jgi:hypothetical protein